VRLTLVAGDHDLTLTAIGRFDQVEREAQQLVARADDGDLE
jgi:hypothetical protein